ncbi:MAG: sel1 repeat family protein [Desulfovibrio sp.]|nr:sel1 repeat family protein [Desulfovibrio sp.]
MILRLIVLSCLLWLSPNLALSATSLAEVQKAALSGDASAANRLGVWYEKGQNGLPKDPTQAVSWYRKAAKLGNILAMHNLGDCYLQQVGVAYDPAQAYAWYKMAAEAGGAIGYEDLGNFFKNIGFDGPDIAKAKTWYAAAARQGRKSAQEKLLALGGPRLTKGKPLAPCRRQELGKGTLQGTLLALSDYGPKNSRKLLTLNVQGKKETLLASNDARDEALSSLLAEPSAFLGKELHLGFVEVQGLDDDTAVCSTHREYLEHSLNSMTKAAKTELSGQTKGDIYIAYDSLLLGAFINKTWVDVQSLQNDPKYHAKRLWGGHSGRIYTEKGFVGEGIMGALFNEHPEEYANHGPLAEFPFFSLHTPQGEFEEECLFITGSGQNFNPLPRTMRRIDDNEHFSAAICSYLAQQGITENKPHNEVFAVDLDGDGQDEYLITARNFPEPGLYMPGHGQETLYSVVLLETQKNGVRVVEPVISYLCPKLQGETIPTKHQIKLCADVNADGTLELIIFSSIHEGASLQIFNYQNGHLRCVLTEGWGV